MEKRARAPSYEGGDDRCKSFVSDRILHTSHALLTLRCPAPNEIERDQRDAERPDRAGEHEVAHDKGSHGAGWGQGLLAVAMVGQA